MKAKNYAKRYQDRVFLGVAWQPRNEVGGLKLFLTPKRYQFQNSTSSPVVYFQLNALKYTANTTTVDLLRLNTLRGNCFFKPKRYDETPILLYWVLRIPQGRVFGEQGNTGNLAMGTREQSKKIVRNKGTINRLGNRGTNTKVTRPYVFYINVGVIEDFLLFSDLFGKFLFPSFVSTRL